MAASASDYSDDLFTRDYDARVMDVSRSVHKAINIFVLAVMNLFSVDVYEQANLFRGQVSWRANTRGI
jgi:hypothetical protein